MADFIAFDEGVQYLMTSGNGLPSPCYFLLSTNTVDQFTKGTTLAGGVAEITGTGYNRLSQAPPAPQGEITTFNQMTWSTGTATNWPTNVSSLVMASSSNNAGHAICAWNLLPGGTSRNLSLANTVEQVTPSLTTTSP